MIADAIQAFPSHCRCDCAARSLVLSDLSNHAPITIYTTAICPYCISAKNFLKGKGLRWTELRIDTDPAERERMVALTKRTSVPQIFVGDVHVGGFDDMMAMHRAGRLEPLLHGEGA
jgi:glutaredoxin 3